MLLVPGFFLRFSATYPEKNFAVYGSVVEQSTMDLLLASSRPAIGGIFAPSQISQENSRKSWTAPPAITCLDGSIGRASDCQSDGRWFESGGDPKFKGQSRSVRGSLLNTSPAISRASQG
ncbi:hypothetical protein Y032_0024g981 [Ancylostoma ceylanicum]|uniref:Uncharacterized protein n=1 Tax=Ancylostoma ceylanicum TaxID=53326 RepID=A0A016T269_9BILA|nr:hypothetical protein Y032_0148g2662 [Ancylostoma ceylanicum]EYC19640.1 hypothetical protein Y032_0024g981 [Ancylostoma ceylanicum]